MVTTTTMMLMIIMVVVKPIHMSLDLSPGFVTQEQVATLLVILEKFCAFPAKMRWMLYYGFDLTTMCRQVDT